MIYIIFIINLFFSILFLGLKKFLAQYPALFLIDGDYVRTNSYQSSTVDDTSGGGTGCTRDYIQEAKEYFKHKLLQYGIGTEVPIKSLLGHRSQASPQVRHISGQHISQFTEFLAKHTDYFQVTDDYVVLVRCEGDEDVPQSERLHLPQPSIDTAAIQQLLDFLAQCIEIKGPVLVDQLFHLVTTNFPQEQWFRMFKTPNDLSTFFKLFSDCFHVQSNLVTLLHKPKLSDSHIQQAQDRFSLHNNNSNNLNRTNSNKINTLRTISPNAINNNSNGNSINSVTSTVSSNTKVGDFKLNEPVTTMNMINNNTNSNQTSHNNNSLTNDKNSQPNSGFDSLITDNEIKLENLCSTNCPSSKIGSYYATNTVESQTSTGTQSSTSSAASSLSPIPQQTTATNVPATTATSTAASTTSTGTTKTTSTTVTATVERNNNKNQTLKQRINNLVIKTLAENLEKDKQSLSALQNVNSTNNSNINNILVNNNNNVNNNSSSNTANIITPNSSPVHNNVNSSSNINNNNNNSNNNNYFVGDTWKIKILQNTRVITTIKESIFVTDAIMKSAQNDQCIVSIDCEGINLGIGGQITLIQIGTTRGEAFIFDIMSCPNLITDGGLKTLLESEMVIKIIHDCRNDSVNLYSEFNIILRNVFDTQVSLFK